MTPAETLALDERRRRPPARLRVLSDERLAARVRQGDERAFEILFERHEPGVLSFCRYLLGTRDEAQDAAQQAFLRLHGALQRERPPAELRPFLYAIARNRCRTLLAARREEAELRDDRPDLSGLADEVQQREDLRALVADIGRLPEDQRAALVLAEMGGLAHAGIAEVLEIPEARVRTLIYQAKSHLLAEREARDRPCEEIRAELATATGAALRRGHLRRHLRSCSGCRAFKTGLARQRSELAIVLPVAAAATAKGGGLAALLSGGAAAAGGSAATVGGGLLGVAKLAAVVAALGAGAAGGTVAVQAVDDDAPARTEAVRTVAPPAAARALEVAASPSAVVTPRVVPAARRERARRGGERPRSATVTPAGTQDARTERREERLARKVARAEQRAARRQARVEQRTKRATERAARKQARKTAPRTTRKPERSPRPAKVLPPSDPKPDRGKDRTAVEEPAATTTPTTTTPAPAPE